MASVLKEAFSGIKIVKAYGQEEKESERFYLMNKAFRRVKVKSAQVSAISSPMLEIIGVCGIAFIVASIKPTLKFIPQTIIGDVVCIVAGIQQRTVKGLI